MKLFKSIITLFALTTVVIPLTAQETSPYSKFGYGMLGDNSTSMQRQMGGTGYAMHSGRQINAMNPASYASVDSMTFLFDIGVDVMRYQRQDNAGKQSDWGGGLDYVTMLFPVSKTVGVSAGLVPYSSVGYAFGSTLDNGTSSHQGSGGINQLYVGTGWNPVKGLSIGFNIGYLFGNTYNAVYATSSTTGVGSVFEQTMEVTDFHLRFGAQYTYNIGPENSVTAALTYDPAKTLLGKTYVVKYLQNSSEAPDTVAPGVVDLKGNFALAESWGAGVAWDNGHRIHAEVDFTYQPWKNTRYSQLENFTATRLADRWKVSVGGSFLPDPRGLSSYMHRVIYRIGAYYNRDYVMVGDNNVREWGVSCGFGLPAWQHATKTLVNVGFEYRHRSSSPVALLTERYFGINIGVNFNGTWFFRNRLR